MVARTACAPRSRCGLVQAMFVRALPFVFHRSLIVFDIHSTCEYMKGCEWREMKANEVAMALKQRQAFKGGQ
jgi:hypothetical protein